MIFSTTKASSLSLRHILAVCSLGLLLYAPLSAASTARADILLIERIQKKHTIPMPSRGTDMTQVRKDYGEPVRTKGPIGEPPITTWVYPRFSCYFEHQWVIDCVAHKTSPLEQGPKPVE